MLPSSQRFVYLLPLCHHYDHDDGKHEYVIEQLYIFVSISNQLHQWQYFFKYLIPYNTNKQSLTFEDKRIVTKNIKYSLFIAFHLN